MNWPVLLSVILLSISTAATIIFVRLIQKTHRTPQGRWYYWACAVENLLYRCTGYA